LEGIGFTLIHLENWRIKKDQKRRKNERLQGKFFYTSSVLLNYVGRKCPSLSGIGRLRSVLLTSKNHPYFSVKMYSPKRTWIPHAANEATTITRILIHLLARLHPEER